MTQRHRAADAIWNGGASNPRGVVRALVAAIDEAVEEGGGSNAAKDPAVQMILDHLCFLCGLPQPSLDSSMTHERWTAIEKEVEERRAE
jgi:hypothetical protein